MNIAVLSGKGGTGKTTVSTNLAKLLNGVYIDCDVEEPNGFIFLKPEITSKTDVKVINPVVDEKKCVLCGKCADACQFNSLAKTSSNVILFEKLCHGCGACGLACDYGAISYIERAIGVVEEGYSGNIKCKRGLLNIGEPIAVPIIKQLLGNLEDGLNILDCSPGSSCNVVNTLLKSDAAVLVTETSEFGLHDLNIAVQLVKKFKLPFGVVINKELSNENIIREYCMMNNIKVLGAIPYDRSAAHLYSQGKMLIEDSTFKNIFEGIAKNIKEVVSWN